MWRNVTYPLLIGLWFLLMVESRVYFISFNYYWILFFYLPVNGLVWGLKVEKISHLLLCWVLIEFNGFSSYLLCTNWLILCFYVPDGLSYLNLGFCSYVLGFQLIFLITNWFDVLISWWLMKLFIQSSGKLKNQIS